MAYSGKACGAERMCWGERFILCYGPVLRTGDGLGG